MRNLALFTFVMALLLCLTLPWSTGAQSLDGPTPIDCDVGDLVVPCSLEFYRANGLAVPIGGHDATLLSCNCGTQHARTSAEDTIFSGEGVFGAGILHEGHARAAAPNLAHNGQAVLGAGVRPRLA